MIGVLGKQIIAGFVVKAIASFDDTLTRIPILAELTKTRKGKVAFSIGTFLALSAILVLVIFFSSVLDLIPFRRFVMAGLILIVAGLVYGEFFVQKEQSLQDKLIKTEKISSTKFMKLVGAGFTISFLTLIDDAIVLAPLFLGNQAERFFAVIGIYGATVIQVLLVIYFSEKINRIKYKKEIAAIGLVILALGVAFGVI